LFPPSRLRSRRFRIKTVGFVPETVYDPGGTRPDMRRFRARRSDPSLPNRCHA
jgi:hypothetical protein